MDFIFPRPADLGSYTAGTKTAPAELIAAVLSFSPTQVVTVAEQTGDQCFDWKLFATTTRGFVVVAASSAPNANDKSTPLVSNVSATWHPINALREIRLDHPRPTSEYYDVTAQVAVAGHWVLEFEGREPIELPDGPAHHDVVMKMLRDVTAERRDPS